MKLSELSMRVVVSKVAHAAYRAQSEAGDAVANTEGVAFIRLNFITRLMSCHTSH